MSISNLENILSSDTLKQKTPTQSQKDLSTKFHNYTLQFKTNYDAQFIQSLKPYKCFIKSDIYTFPLKDDLQKTNYHLTLYDHFLKYSIGLNENDNS